MLDIRRLALLRELDARGSIAAVSRALGISSSAISQQLTKLEVEVGVNLLEQVGRNVELTPAARRLSRRADEAIAILEHAEAELDARRGQVQGVVRLATFNTFALRYLPELLERVAETHPQVAVEFSQIEPAEALEAVTGRRVDVAVTDEYPQIPRPVDTALVTTHLCRDELTVYTPSALVDVEELRSVPWVFEPAGSDASAWARRVCRGAGFEPTVRFHSPDLRVHYELCVSGHAAAFLPRMVLDFTAGAPPHRSVWPQGGAEDLYRDVYAVTRRGARMRPTVAALLAGLEAVTA